MKLKSVAVLLVSLYSIFGFAQLSQLHLTEIKLDTVLTPLEGYDDNDNIQLVLHGEMPNGCFRIGPTQAKVVQKTILVTQYAVENVEGVCADKANMPFHMQIP